MVNLDVDDQIWALRAEADESRRLADTLGDAQSAADLQAYALELEAEAANLQLEEHPGPEWQTAFAGGKHDRGSLKRPAP